MKENKQDVKESYRGGRRGRWGGGGRGPYGWYGTGGPWPYYGYNYVYPYDRKPEIYVVNNQSDDKLNKALAENQIQLHKLQAEISSNNAKSTHDKNAQFFIYGSIILMVLMLLILVVRTFR